MQARIILVSVFLIIGLNIYSQVIPNPYEVGIWSGFRSSAINYTFDDGCQNQFNIAIPLFNEFDFKLTLFTVTNWVSKWTAFESAAANGHEVASHTVSHPNFSNIKLEKQESELKNSKDVIENYITDKSCLTIAYPYCVTGTDSMVSKYYISARGCQGFIESKTPGSYLNISSIMCGNTGSVNTLEDFKNKFNCAANKNGWLIFLFHGIDNDGGYSPINSEELRKSIEYLSLRKSKFWITTFLNSTLYSKERDMVHVTETFASDSSMTLQVTDTLPDSIYNYPLTLRCPLPGSWPSADVTQDGVAVPMRIVLVDSVVYINFDVVPDAGEIIISRNMNPVTPEIDTIPDDKVEPINIKQTNSKNTNIKTTYIDGTLIIFMSDQIISDLEFNLYDIKGIKLMSQKLKYSSYSNIKVDMTSISLKTGIYFIHLTDGKKTWNKKIFVS